MGGRGSSSNKSKMIAGMGWSEEMEKNKKKIDERIKALKTNQQKKESRRK